jgi:hypothetical protein
MYPFKRKGAAVSSDQSTTTCDAITRHFPDQLDVGDLFKFTKVDMDARPKVGDPGLGKFYWQYLRCIMRNFNQKPKAKTEADADADADADAAADERAYKSRFAMLYSTLSDEDGDASRRRFNEVLQEAKAQEKVMRTMQQFRDMKCALQQMSVALLEIGHDEVYKNQCTRTRQVQTADQYNLLIFNFAVALFDEVGDVLLLYELYRLSFSTQPELHWLFALDAVLLTVLLLCRVFFYRRAVKAHQTFFNRVAEFQQQTEARKLAWYQHVAAFGGFMLDPKSIPLILGGLSKTDLPPLKVGRTLDECRSNNNFYTCLYDEERLYVERRQKWVTWTVLAEDLPGIGVQAAYGVLVEDELNNTLFWISVAGAALSILSVFVPIFLQRIYDNDPVKEDDRIWRPEAALTRPNERLYKVIGPHRLLTHTFTLRDGANSGDKLTLIGHILNHADLTKEHIDKASVLIESVVSSDSKETIEKLLDLTVKLANGFYSACDLKHFLLNYREGSELIAAFAKPPSARDAILALLFQGQPIPVVEDAQVLSIRCRIHRQSDCVSTIEVRLTDGTIFLAPSYLKKGGVAEGYEFEVMDVFAPGEYIKSVRVYGQYFGRPEGIVFDIHNASGHVRSFGHINRNLVSFQQAGITNVDNFVRNPPYKRLSSVDEKALSESLFHDIPKAVSKARMRVVECPGSTNTNVAEAQPSVCWMAPDGFQILGLSLKKHALHGTCIDQGK